MPTEAIGHGAKLFRDLVQLAQQLKRLRLGAIVVVPQTVEALTACAFVGVRLARHQAPLAMAGSRWGPACSAAMAIGGGGGSSLGG